MAAATEKTFWDKRYGRNFLKITALLTMLIDHIGCVFLMDRGDVIYKAFRAVGRISFPIICFMLVEGFIHTHSRKKYMINLLIFSIISEISSLEKSPKLINARNGMESVIARTIFSEMASVAASEADFSPPFMLERYFEVSSFANSFVRGSRNSSPRVVFI